MTNKEMDIGMLVKIKDGFKVNPNEDPLFMIIDEFEEGDETVFVLECLSHNSMKEYVDPRELHYCYYPV